MRKATFGVFAIALAVATTSVANARPVHRQDTLQLEGVFSVIWHGVVCPAGTPDTTACYLWAGPGVVPGLGSAQESYEVFLDQADSACWHASWQTALTVAGRGEIDAAMQIPGCANQNSPNNVPATFTVTGGSGSYAGATGSGTLATKPDETSFGSGTSIDTWQGTLDVPGLSFDTTAPTISHVANLHVKTKAKKRARVIYKLPKANDPTDGNLPVTCRPAPGARFRIGHTRIHCKATDKDGNTATTSITITVTRTRRP